MNRISNALAAVARVAGEASENLWDWLGKFAFHDYLMGAAALSTGIGIGLTFGPGWGFTASGLVLVAFAFPPIVLRRQE